MAASIVTVGRLTCDHDPPRCRRRHRRGWLDIKRRVVDMKCDNDRAAPEASGLVAHFHGKGKGAHRLPESVVTRIVVPRQVFARVTAQPVAALTKTNEV